MVSEMARTPADTPADETDADPARAESADADGRRLRARSALGCFAAALAVVVGAIGLTGVELLLVWLVANSVILAGAYLFLPAAARCGGPARPWSCWPPSARCGSSPPAGCSSWR